MGKRIISSVNNYLVIKNNIFIDTSRGLSIADSERVINNVGASVYKTYNYNTIYYFDKLMNEKFLEITTKVDLPNYTVSSPIIKDETIEINGGHLWL